MKCNNYLHFINNRVNMSRFIILSKIVIFHTFIPYPHQLTVVSSNSVTLFICKKNNNNNNNSNKSVILHQMFLGPPHYNKDQLVFLKFFSYLRSKMQSTTNILFINFYYLFWGIAVMS
jgi:hypothetical protein